MANSVDPDQTASSEAVWSWSALFAEAYLSQYIEFLRYIHSEQGETERTANFSYQVTQGTESHYLFWLFCTCVWTEWVRKLFITSIKLIKFSCGKVQIPCLCEQQMNIEVFLLHAVVFLLEVVQKIIASTKTALRGQLATKKSENHMKIHWVLKKLRGIFSTILAEYRCTVGQKICGTCFTCSISESGLRTISVEAFQINKTW